MAFEQLGDKLQAIIKKVKGQSKLTEQNMEEMIKEIRISLLEADVNYKVVKLQQVLKLLIYLEKNKTKSLY